MLTRALVVAGIAFLCLVGCSVERGYWVIVLADRADYRAGMRLEELREVMFGKSYTMRLFAADGKRVRLFRYAHDWPAILPLDDALLHISTPIIVERKHKTLKLEIIDRKQRVTTRVVAVDKLNKVRGERHFRVLLIDLPPEAK